MWHRGEGSFLGPVLKRCGGIGLGLATMAMVVAACGTSSGEPTTGTAFQQYLACLAGNGVVLPSTSAGPRGSGGPRASDGPRTGESAPPSPRPSGSRGPGGGGFGGGGFGGFGNQPPAGVDQATWEKAQQACGGLRPSAGPSGGTGGRNNSALTAYRNCLTEHGVTLTGNPDGLNTADPTVAAAVKACEPLRPAPRPTATPTP